MAQFGLPKVVNIMPVCHEHNLRSPLPEHRAFGIRVQLKAGDPFRNLVGSEWSKEHWYATERERDHALTEMSQKYIYFRPGDQPALHFEVINKN
jgi:hypothetical protein